MPIIATIKRFAVTTEGPDQFGLAALCQRYCDEQWLADHATPEQAAEMVREQFRRALLAEIELLNVRCEVSDSPC